MNAVVVVVVVVMCALLIQTLSAITLRGTTPVSVEKATTEAAMAHVTGCHEVGQW